MKTGLLTAGIVFLTAIFSAAPLRAQPAAQTATLAGYKVALLVLDPPPDYWHGSQKAHGGPSGAELPADAKAPKKPADAQAGWKGGSEKLRFVTAVNMASQFKRAGADVRLIFMGPAVLWLSMDPLPANPKAPQAHGPHALLDKVKAEGVEVSAEEWASNQYAVHDKISSRSMKFVNRDSGSAPALAAQGFHILVF